MTAKRSGKFGGHRQDTLKPHWIVLLEQLRGRVAKSESQLLAGQHAGKRGKVKETRLIPKLIMKFQPDLIGVGALDDSMDFISALAGGETMPANAVVVRKAGKGIAEGEKLMAGNGPTPRLGAQPKEIKLCGGIPCEIVGRFVSTTPLEKISEVQLQVHCAATIVIGQTGSLKGKLMKAVNPPRRSTRFEMAAVTLLAIDWIGSPDVRWSNAIKWEPVRIK